jgi:hypothetical protein
MENMAEVLEMILLEISLSVASSIFLLLVHSFLNGTQKNEKPLSPSAKVNRPTSNNWPTTWEEKRRHMGFSLDAQKSSWPIKKPKKKTTFSFLRLIFTKASMSTGRFQFRTRCQFTATSSVFLFTCQFGNDFASSSFFAASLDF